MDTLSVARLGFLILTVLTVLAVDQIFFSKRVTDPRRMRSRLYFWVAIAVWASAVSVAAIADVFRAFSALPPPIIMVLLVPIITLVCIVRFPAARSYMCGVSVTGVLLLQAFRFPVELLLWALFLDNVLPIQMTFEGRNWDILTGLTAPVIAWWVARRPTFPVAAVVAWNVVGLVLLVNIVVIAVLSSPVPFRVFMNEPANTEVAGFPVVLLPAVLVPVAAGLHVVSLVQALGRPAISTKGGGG